MPPSAANFPSCTAPTEIVEWSNYRNAAAGKVAAVILSHGPQELADRSLDSFSFYNTYPTGLPILVTDYTVDKLRPLNNRGLCIPGLTDCSWGEFLGLVQTRSTAEFLFVFDDTIEFTEFGFIEKSLTIMESNSAICGVFLTQAESGNRGLGGHTLYVGDLPYFLTRQSDSDADSGLSPGHIFIPGLRRGARRRPDPTSSSGDLDLPVVRAADCPRRERAFFTAILAESHVRRIGAEAHPRADATAAFEQPTGDAPAVVADAQQMLSARRVAFSGSATARTPEVSIVIPVYNKERYLEACLTSILVQSFSDIEIICIDDFSTDGCRDILADFARKDQRIRVYRNSTNLGPGPSRNRAIEKARGRFIQFTDADDLLPVDAIEALHRLAIDTASVAVRGSCSAYPEGPTEMWLKDTCAGFIAPDRTRFSFEDEPTFWVPWFHTTYLFSRRFLVERDIRYPALREGEDPVFLASVLTTSDHLSATPKVCYIYRTDRPYRRSSVLYRLHHLRHIALIKEIYGQTIPNAWHRACSPFYLSIVRDYLDALDGRSHQPDVVEIANLLSKIWCPKQLASVGIHISDAGFWRD